MRPALFLSLCAFLVCSSIAHATSNHEYGADEYDTIGKGISPNGKYAITTHGDGDLGYDNFHVYLTNAVTGEKIGPLEEIIEFLDTGANAFCAQWSEDSQYVTIIYRVSRHKPLKAVTYRIGKGRAFPLKGPDDATADEAGYYADFGAGSQPRERVFGKSKTSQ